MLQEKKNFARPGEKRKNLALLHEKKVFLAKEKLRATKKSVIAAFHLGERIIDFDDDDEDFFSSFPQNISFISRY